MGLLCWAALSGAVAERVVWLVDALARGDLIRQWGEAVGVCSAAGAGVDVAAFVSVDVGLEYEGGGGSGDGGREGGG